MALLDTVTRLGTSIINLINAKVRAEVNSLSISINDTLESMQEQINYIYATCTCCSSPVDPDPTEPTEEEPTTEPTLPTQPSATDIPVVEPDF